MNLFCLLSLFMLVSCATSPKSVYKQLIPAKTLKLCFIGDTGTKDVAQKEVASQLEMEKCHSIHFLGDIIYSDGLKDHHDKQFLTKFWDYYQKTTEIDHKPNLNIVLGNHDHEGSVDAWMELSKKYPKVFFPYPWYLLKINDVCIVHTDTDYYRFLSNYFMGMSQYNWLKSIRKDLKDCRLKIALAHHPYNSSGEKHSNSVGPMRWILEHSIIGKYDFYIAGHEHILSDEGEIDGTRLLISGAGGRRDRNEVGYLVMKISDQEVSYEFRKLSK